MVAASVCAAGVALGDIGLPFAWQVWHLVTSIFTLRGRRGTYGTRLALVRRLVPVWRRGRRLRLRDIGLRFAWQAWHLVTSILTLLGRRGTYGTGLALVTRLVPVWRRGLAGVALGDIHPHFAWQAWHLWHWAGTGDALGSRVAPWSTPPFACLVTSAFILCGRRGTW